MTELYTIADEPKGKLSHIAVSPLVLLLVSLFIPKPFQLLMPLVFLANGWLMGSHNLKKQIVTVVVGAFLIVLFLFLTGLLVNSGIIPFGADATGPYIGILFNAAFFVLLYKLLLLQNPIYELLSYIRQQSE